MNDKRTNLIISLSLIVIYILGQILIGTYDPKEGEFVYDTPSDVDFLYYGSIINQLLNDFPPDNPSYSGHKLTQPFIHYYPAALLSKILNPYNSIRILNLAYLVIFGLILRKLFPAKYGIMMIIIFAASVPGTEFNALGVDFIARGFTHIPFFILLTLALFSKNSLIRFTSISIAPLINGYMMLIIIPFLGIRLLQKRNKDNLMLLFGSLFGSAVAWLILRLETVEKPFYFILSESFGINPGEILLHSLPFIILIIITGKFKSLILLLCAVVFGACIHYNPFFPIFLVYFAGALIIAESDKLGSFRQYAIYAVTAVIFIAFLFAATEKYDPNNGNYITRYDETQTAAVDWVRNNTAKDASFAALMPGNNELAFIMQYRPVYLGFAGHLAHLGINWRPRYNKLIQLYGGGFKIDEIDYVYYGPLEKKYFPNVSYPFDIAYRDRAVTIYKME